MALFYIIACIFLLIVKSVFRKKYNCIIESNNIGIIFNFQKDVEEPTKLDKGTL